MDKGLGVHFLVDMYICNSQFLDDVDSISRILHEAAKAANTTVCEATFRKFSPQGVTGVLVLEESHISIHTWPEHFYAAIDIFTCGDQAMPDKAVAYLIQQFNPSYKEVNKIQRGEQMHL